MILQKNNVILDNDVTTRKNHDSSSVNYIDTAKVSQWRLVVDNRRAIVEAKNETENKTAAQKLCLQQKWSEAF